MGKSVSFMTLTSAIGFALMGAGLQSSANVHAAEVRFITATQHVETSAAQTVGIQTYIITFAEAGLLRYNGSVSGLQSTAPLATDGHRKLDVHTSAAQAYATYLVGQRETHVAAIDSALGRPLTVTHQYAITENGISADLSAAEAATVATVPGVKSVRLAGEQHLLTYRGPTFIGADKIWDGTATPGGAATATRGQGILVGDLDGGTNSSHPSFANDPTCGFLASAPKLVAVDCSATDVNGFCAGPDPEATPGFGHGVHTSSTIAGNTIDNTVTPAPVLPDGVTMSGVAPCAAIHQYKVCQTNSCAGADIFAGIQNAIADQVDVLNFSISGGTDPWNDNDRNFLDAVNADVFVAAAAGNLQAGQTDPHGLVNHLGPWLMTVAASTQDQLIGPQLTVTGPGTVPPGLANIPLNPGSTTNTANTIDLTGQPLLTYPTNILGCTASGGFPANYFQGSIAVLRRGTCTFTEKITNAAAAGAEMVVIGNNQAGSVNMDTTGSPAVPAFSILQTPGDALIAFIAPNNPPPPPADRVFADGFDGVVAPTGTTVGDYKRAVLSATQGDVLANFSDRGPTPAPTVDSTKPDISAPGVNIYAASDPASGNYQFMSGTSMATPHVTGAGALVRAVHPDWSVEEVKSALMMTATNTNGVEEDGATPWTIDDVGSGRVDLTVAALAGLTMDETYANFLAADPAALGDVKTLNVPELRNMSCAVTGCTWTRTVKNRLATSGTWNVTSTTASSFAVIATPTTFTLAAGATQTITFTATPNTALTIPVFGMVTLTEVAGQSPAQHITVAVNQPAPLPPSVVCSAGNCTFKIDGLPATGGTFNSLGCGASPCTFLWLNRFSPAPTDYPITLNTVQTIFSSTGTAVGDTFDIYIYQDTDNDPSNGATFKGSVLGQTVAAAQNSLQTITIPGGLALTGSGDILIALVTRTPSPYPGSADNGVADQQRSWISGLGGSIANPPDLSTLGLAHPGDVLPGFTHNWIIRANGTNGSSQPVVLGSGLPRNK